ncbi:BREX-1 system adenine-specific DNA-methyltransferase PglX [Synechococcus sp. A15-44]|uniref:BREX-1 system adenine-specific DNA-methyltransferase PglX n=1 Tax=Synechococcus sp. A15-44 TaxID=1050646 RepID=UPI0016479927|nr:BREX-1 system adenine-specific DNA-methyltransferase PglX [Synechococcus sp. A15-44]QNI65413.1 Putative Type IIC bifunctional restriction-modification protein with endonuclease and N6-adenine DNA methyltransferase activity [Synechococcus sp. A15-44]
MAVNTAALKTFAPAMRRQLMEAVGRKLDLLLNSQTPDTLSTYAKQIAELREEQEKSREQLLERVAYTWFNRLCALRYLDAKGWHPFGCKVLMPADGSETQPELLKLMRSGSLPADLQAFTNEQRLNQLLDGQIPTAIPGGDAQGEVYRELVLAACRSYHQLLPDLFEGLDDASELLLPDDLLTEGSIAGSFRSSISDTDCDNVEIIGWLYQFYISEKKDEVIGKVVKSEDIPAATQLFTPNWIVKYMVQNTIGAQWLATYPDSPLREQMEFYIEPAEQTDEVKAKLAEITPKSLNPEELTLMDPACGSGHILVEAYEIFKAIYLEQGYQLREIPKLIFENNLFGLDIDQRAAQLTTFGLMMKGRADDRRLFERETRLNVMALQESTNFDTIGLAEQIDLSANGLELKDLNELKQLFEHATTFGSLIQVPTILREKLETLKKLSELPCDNLFASNKLALLGALVQQSRLLSKKYGAVAANPPYMGSSGMNSYLKEFAKSHYRRSKGDLYSCFIERCCSLTKLTGSCSMITMQSWMFLSSFEEIRKSILREKSIASMLHIGYNSFPSMNSKIAQASAFTLLNTHVESLPGAFIDLNSAPQTADKKSTFLARTPASRFDVTSEEFEEIPGSPLAYWASEKLRLTFKNRTIEEITISDGQNKTGDNERFLRYSWELSRRVIGKDKKWIFYAKGGGFRRWSGNLLDVVNWTPGAREHYKRDRICRIIPEYLWFRRGITWGLITSSLPSFRILPIDATFDVGGSSIFFIDEKDLLYTLGLLNSKASFYILQISNPTLNFQVRNIREIPFISCKDRNLIHKNVELLVEIHEHDWNLQERSINYSFNPLIGLSADCHNIQASFEAYVSKSRASISEVNNLEEINNEIFNAAYGLSEELDPDIPIEEISLFVNPAHRYGGDGTEEEKWERFQCDSIAELISYATGCMMGRYSLDHPGLILADSRRNQEEQLAAYEAKIGKPISEIKFQPDSDAIIPVLEGEWFEDDIVARTREFLKVTFPESSVAENLRFIEDSIGKDIRKYFCKDFYKDHLQTYKKRPIYWMVQSPKAGFACLIYLHRYTPDTLLQVLNNYFRPYLQKLEARQEQLERDQSNDALPKREQTAARKEAEKITKVLKECQAWEQDALLPLAQQRIELVLDDGVKVNYLKLQEVLAKIPGLAAKGD